MSSTKWIKQVIKKKNITSYKKKDCDDDGASMTSPSLVFCFVCFVFGDGGQWGRAVEQWSGDGGRQWFYFREKVEKRGFVERESREAAEDFLRNEGLGFCFV